MRITLLSLLLFLEISAEGAFFLSQSQMHIPERGPVASQIWHCPGAKMEFIMPDNCRIVWEPVAGELTIRHELDLFIVEMQFFEPKRKAAFEGIKKSILNNRNQTVEEISVFSSVGSLEGLQLDWKSGEFFIRKQIFFLQKEEGLFLIKFQTTIKNFELQNQNFLALINSLKIR